MVNLDVAELRSKIDSEGKYVEFNLLRTTLTAATLVKDLDISLSDPSKEGECRGKCPKCGKAKSFCLNTNTNRFNCFAKGCNLKGGGVIDFFAKLNEVSAKEASHLLACAYSIEPYTQKPIDNSKPSEEPVAQTLPAETEMEVPLDSAIASQTVPVTAQHLITSIEQQFAELKKLLATY